MAWELSIWIKAFSKKFMCEFSSLFEAIHVYPSLIVCQVMQAIFVGDAIGDDGNMEAHVFKIFDVKGENFALGVEMWS